MTNPETISLILGSGGARGLTHIGVIRELERRGYVISSIVGCSMGALIGGFHAAGKLDAYEAWVTKLSEWDVLRFLDISLTSRSGMMKGDLIMDKLRALVGDVKIEDLPLRFTAVATDVVNHKEVWLSRGDLFDAIRASIAIPGTGARTRIPASRCATPSAPHGVSSTTTRRSAATRSSATPRGSDEDS